MAINSDFSQQVNFLIQSQMQTWNFASKNYLGLAGIKQKKLQFKGFSFIVQFNPGRIISSSAKTDKISIENRACFLCKDNRPTEQKSLDFANEFNVLINPYPIFPQHLTIVHKNHVPQAIKPYFQSMLELAKAMPLFTIFYNGSQYGASAPDHFHFQAGTKNIMSLDYQIESLKSLYGKLKFARHCHVWKIDDGIRKFFLIESEHEQEIKVAFTQIYEKLEKESLSDDEPGLNMHCSYTDKTWKVILFPRGKHRPKQYYVDGEENVMFSPASVDLGGLLIVPLEKDYEKMDIPTATDLMKQIGPDEKLFNKIDVL